MKKEHILVIGSNGQIGTVLTEALRERYSDDQVIATDIREPAVRSGRFETLDVLDAEALNQIIKKNSIQQIYHLAAILSAKGEQNPKWAWEVNMSGLFHILEAAREHGCRVFFPSSIAVFGGESPKEHTPQHAVLQPQTVYGISKVAGEHWCNYYFNKYGVDARSVRYPGIISYQSLPGGGTTDYAVDIYHKAVQGEAYECFLAENTPLPMMYMPDAIRATLDLMHAPAEQVKLRIGYNIAAMSFTPKEIYEAIRQEVPDFQISYKPDFRQSIAESWPASIDASAARADWGWQPAYDLEKMTKDMLTHLAERYQGVG